MTATEFTTNYQLAKPDFNLFGWHDDVNGNSDIIDSILFALTGLSNFVGAWTNSTNYVVGQRVIDPDDASIWNCGVSHTSSATDTMADDRAAHPTYWTHVTSIPQNRGQWTNSTVYNIGDLVYDTNENLFGMANILHTSSISPATMRDDISNFAIIFDGGVIASTGRTVLTGNTPVYVRSDGNDNNTGLANTAGGAFRTTARAINWATEEIDCRGFTPTINFESGVDWGEIAVNKSILGSDTPLILKTIGGKSSLALSGSARVRLDTCTLDRDPGDEATGLVMTDDAYCEFVSGTFVFGENLALDFALSDHSFFNADGDYDTRMKVTSFKYYHGSVSGHARYRHDSGTGYFWNTDNPKPPDPGQGTYVLQVAVFLVSGHAQLTANGPFSYTGSVDDVTASELLMTVQCEGPYTALIGNMSSITEGQANAEFPAGFWELVTGGKGCIYIDDDNNDLGRFHFIDGLVISDSVMSHYDVSNPVVGGYYGGYKGKGTANFKNGVFEQGYRLGSLVIDSGTTNNVNLAAFVDLYTSRIRRLRIEFSLVAGTDGTQLEFRTSADGTNFDSGGSDYSYQKDEIDNGASVIAGSNAATSIIATTATIGNAATERITGWIEVENPGQSAKWPMFLYEVKWIDNSATPRLRTVRGVGARRSASIIKGIQFNAAAGSISSVDWSAHHLQSAR